MLKRGLKKGFIYQDFGLACELCGRPFKTPQGLAGHRRLMHSSAGPETPSRVLAGPVRAALPGSVKELESQVKTLKLEEEKRQLEARLPSVSNKPADLMERAGLGTLDGEAKTVAQMRALGIPQVQQPTWFDKVLANPQALQLAINGIKGVLGVSGQGNGDNSLSLLRDWGFNLKDLITGALAPKAGPTFEVGGISMAGVAMTPELLTSIIQYKSATEAAQKDSETKKFMLDGLVSALKPLSELVQQRFMNPGEGISARPAGRQPAQQVTAVCPKCGFTNILASELVPGQEVRCQGPDCGETWIVVDSVLEAKAQAETIKRQVKIKPAEAEFVNCPNCGQAIKTDKPLGSDILCPVCENEFKLTSETEPLPALTPEEKALRHLS